MMPAAKALLWFSLCNQRRGRWDYLNRYSFLRACLMSPLGSQTWLCGGPHSAHFLQLRWQPANGSKHFEHLCGSGIIAAGLPTDAHDWGCSRARPLFDG